MLIRRGKREYTRKPKTSTLVLIVLAVFLLFFVVAMTAIFCVKGSVPDTLITCVLDTSKFEALALSAIRISKVFKGEDDVR